MSDIDLPDVDDILQSEAEPVGEDTPTAVAVEGPVRTQDLPCVANGMKRFTFTDGTTVKRIVAANPKRSRTTIKIITAGGIFHMGLTEAQALADTAPQWAGTEPLRLRSRNELWACAPIATSLAPITLSVIVEDWAG